MTISNINDHISIRCYENKLERLWGYLHYLFDRALYVEDGARTYYVKVTDLIDRLTDCKNKTLPPSLFSSKSRIQLLTKEILNPIVGLPTSIEKIRLLFEQFRTKELLPVLSLANEDQIAVEATEQMLQSLKMRKLEALSYDPQELQNRLKPGDILFKKQHESNPHVVVLGQRLIQPILASPKERESYKYSHVAIYVGDGKIAEASPHPGGCEVRIVDLSDSHFSLGQDSKNQYLVTRPADEAMGLEAAKVAKKVAAESNLDNANETPFKYTELQAFRSILHPSNFGPFARYRYMKQYIDDHKNQLPKDFMGLKSFFCSYFVGYCYQTAESRYTMPKLLGEFDGPIRGVTALDSAIWRGLWARVRRIEFWDEMSELIKYKFDAKRLTPQDFRNFIATHPNLFQDQFVIEKALPEKPCLPAAELPPAPLPTVSASEPAPTEAFNTEHIPQLIDSSTQTDELEEAEPAAAVSRSICDRATSALLYPATLISRFVFSIYPVVAAA